MRIQVTEKNKANGVLDLGDIELTPSFGPRLGEQVPDFQFEALDGSIAQLSDFQGKYVLLNFWATWCIPCVAKLPELKRLRDKYDSAGLVVLGMSFDKDKAKAKEFVEERELVWEQGVLGDWGDTPVATQLGISSVPTYILVDPQGRLAFVTCSLEEMTRKLSDTFDEGD